MIKTQEGYTNFKGSTETIIADFMSMCDGFISFLKGEFKVDEIKAINGFSSMTEIVKEAYNNHNEGKIEKRLYEVLEYLTEDEIKQQPKPPKAIVIEADSLEDAVEQIGDILKDITGMDGDK